MQPYTPTESQLGDIELPQDMVDDVVVGTVNPAIQDVANGVKYVDGAHGRALATGYGIYQAAATSFAAATDITMSAVSESSAPRCPVQLITLEMVELNYLNAVPSAINGLWEIRVELEFDGAGTDSTVELHMGDHSTDLRDGSHRVAVFKGTTPTSGTTRVVHGSHVFVVSDSQRVRFLLRTVDAADFSVPVDFLRRQVVVRQLSRDIA